MTSPLRILIMYLITASFGLTVIISASSVIQNQLNMASPTLQQWTTHISNESFVRALSMEIPLIDMHAKSIGMDMPMMSNIVLELVTSLNPKDPRTLIRRELPGF